MTTLAENLRDHTIELFWSKYSHCTCGVLWQDITDTSTPQRPTLKVTYLCKTTRDIRADANGGDYSYAPVETLTCVMTQRNNLRKELEDAESRIRYVNGLPAQPPAPAGPNYDHHHAHLGHMLHCNYCDFTFTIHSQDVAGITPEQFFDPDYRLPCPSCKEQDGYLHWRWACDAEVEADPANQDWVKETVRK